MQVQTDGSHNVRLQEVPRQAHPAPAVAVEDSTPRDALQRGAISAVQPPQATCTTDEAQLEEQADFITAAAMDTVSLLRELPGYLDVSLEGHPVPGRAGSAAAPVCCESRELLYAALLALQKLIYMPKTVEIYDLRACFSFWHLQAEKRMPYTMYACRRPHGRPTPHLQWAFSRSSKGRMAASSLLSANSRQSRPSLVSIYNCCNNAENMHSGST